MKKHAPATLRNREAIAAALAAELPDHGAVLEIASGSGEHAAFFAERLPQIIWQPSDTDNAALASIAAYRDEYSGRNMLPPLSLNASDPASWPISQAEAVVCINMVHISPWEATLGLFEGAARLLKPGSPLVLYGPYFEDGETPAQSNLDFDASLRARDNRWSIRNISDMDKAARGKGFERSARHQMPANNLTLVYRCR